SISFEETSHEAKPAYLPVRGHRDGAYGGRRARACAEPELLLLCREQLEHSGRLLPAHADDDMERRSGADRYAHVAQVRHVSGSHSMPPRPDDRVRNHQHAHALLYQRCHLLLRRLPFHRAYPVLME